MVIKIKYNLMENIIHLFEKINVFELRNFRKSVKNHRISKT